MFQVPVHCIYILELDTRDPKTDILVTVVAQV